MILERIDRDYVYAMLLKYEVNRPSGSPDIMFVRCQQKFGCILHKLHYWCEFLLINNNISWQCYQLCHRIALQIRGELFHWFVRFPIVRWQQQFGCIFTLITLVMLLFNINLGYL